MDRGIDLFILSLLAVSLMACQSKEKQIEDNMRSVKVGKIVVFSDDEYLYTGKILASDNTNLSFQVSGPLINVNVEEGELISKGKVIASIDPENYRLQVAATKAAYITAESQEERNNRLLSRQAISRQEYELSVANTAMAKSKYEAALRDLENTKLIAPYSGFIEKKYVNNYQKVQAGQSIVSLVDPNKIEIRFLVPETEVRLTQLSLSLSVEFDNYPDRWFNASLKEIIDASPNGAGIPFTVVIDDPSFDPVTCRIYPGFACRIRMTVPKLEKNTFLLPLVTVIGALNSNKTFVWKYEPTSHTVERVYVHVIGLTGTNQVILKGELTNEDYIVYRGGVYITDGQKVNALNMNE